jgi:hypothetical protein
VIVNVVAVELQGRRSAACVIHLHCMSIHSGRSAIECRLSTASRAHARFPLLQPATGRDRKKTSCAKHHLIATHRRMLLGFLFASFHRRLRLGIASTTMMFSVGVISGPKLPVDCAKFETK